MSYGLCCVTEPRSRNALQLDIFIEIPSYSGRSGEQLRSSVDPALASRGLDWTPEVDLTTGLTSTLRSFGAVENTEPKQG
jgi:dTDP-D-glucose 4,6-dehydratase